MVNCKYIFGLFLALISASQSVGMQSPPLPALQPQQALSLSLNKSLDWMPADQRSEYLKIIPRLELPKIKEKVFEMLRFVEKQEGYWECPLCTKKFPLPFHIAMHQLLHHAVDTSSLQPPKDLDNKTMCLICGLYISKPKHGLHINDKHEAIANGKFECFCGKSFLCESSLNFHKTFYNHQTPTMQSPLQQPSSQLKAVAILHAAAIPKQSLIPKNEIPDFLGKRKEFDTPDENQKVEKLRKI